jgi:hypothetical protein
MDFPLSRRCLICASRTRPIILLYDEIVSASELLVQDGERSLLQVLMQILLLSGVDTMSSKFVEAEEHFHVSPANTEQRGRYHKLNGMSAFELADANTDPRSWNVWS